MNQNDLKQRTKMFALKIIKLVETLPRGRTADVLGNQLLRSGTSVGANYRAACRARSSADFISKMGIVEEEIDESLYWIELLETSGMVSHEKVTDLLNEANQLTAITVASIKTAKQSKRRAL
jgi:four helix bundle protein